ncbi:hypothetical protein JZ751_000373 [Albula glossodonta]|uniref:Uncharacterized protein n=1 Tax=Albula glossodonta TaxID=121402 RepID=A0A8T2PW18_9TELE|nr:hypothetical protein JZ751_000373 [Albula glossodonta]
MGVNLLANATWVGISENLCDLVTLSHFFYSRSCTRASGRLRIMAATECDKRRQMNPNVQVDTSPECVQRQEDVR